MPTSLPKECAKATQIFNSFASIIPQEILRGAKGFAILTIAKAGFLFSARAGTGLVIVKLANGGGLRSGTFLPLSCLINTNCQTRLLQLGALLLLLEL
jgi:lipid-binding SYLF domain-containing protein